METMLLAELIAHGLSDKIDDLKYVISEEKSLQINGAKNCEIDACDRIEEEIKNLTKSVGLVLDYIKLYRGEFN
tara:strand:- start:576 stop:797 length:222 start_codon:yes stop_codon:yes gene_type:complete